MSDLQCFSLKSLVFRITGLRLNEKDADFLFDMVDSNNDGVINTETEIILDLEHEKFFKWIIEQQAVQLFKKPIFA